MLRAAWLLAAIATVVGSLLPSSSAAIRLLDRLPVSDKWEHFAAYALLAFLPALTEQPNVVAAAVSGAAVLGVALEFAQRATGWRDFEVADMIADAIGVCMGLVIGNVIRARLPADLRPCESGPGSRR